MGHGHGHGHLSPRTDSASGRYIPALVAALVIGATVMVAEFTVGFATSSLALISDAAHMFTDVLGIGMALVAVQLARRSGPTFTRTFGMYRAESWPRWPTRSCCSVSPVTSSTAITRITDPPEVPACRCWWSLRSVWSRTSSRSCCYAEGPRRASALRGAYLLSTSSARWGAHQRCGDPHHGLALRRPLRRRRHGVFVLPAPWCSPAARCASCSNTRRTTSTSRRSTTTCALSGVEDVTTCTSGPDLRHGGGIAHLTVGADVDTAHARLGATPTVLALRHRTRHAPGGTEGIGSPLRSTHLVGLRGTATVPRPARRACHA